MRCAMLYSRIDSCISARYRVVVVAMSSSEGLDLKEMAPKERDVRVKEEEEEIRTVL